MWKLLSGSACERSPLIETLNDMQGRQMWVFDPKAGTPEQLKEVDRLRSEYSKNRYEQKNSADELLRLQCTGKHDHSSRKKSVANTELTDENVTAAIKEAVGFFEQLQQDDGHWAGDYGGPMFLLPGMVATLYVTGLLDTVLTPHHKEEMLRYLKNHQNQDGGFGLHIEGHSTMFGTGLRSAPLF
jgi:cycloartenol synthase